MGILVAICIRGYQV